MKHFFVLAFCLLAIFPSLAMNVGKTGEAVGFPYIIYNSTDGVYYGLIGEAKNLLGRDESFTLGGQVIPAGGNSANFILSFPDADDRHGKMFPLGFDLYGELGDKYLDRYYGLGGNTPSSGYTTFNNRYNKMTFKFTRPFTPKLLGEFDVYTSTNDPYSITQGLSPITPAIIADTNDYAGTSIKLLVDTRDQNLDPHTGLYFINNLDFGVRNCDYKKVGLDLRNYTNPINSSQVLASRFMVQQAFGDVIPLYEYPFLGGRDTLRGYTTGRWRDKAAALLNLEYRSPLFTDWIQGVLFYEAGKVGPVLTDIGLDRWPSDYGFGVHLILGDTMLVRGDFGFGSEGMNAYFFYGQAF
ncbi:MAG: BamA/TamA family outer membrane protein [bacterium]